MEFPSPPQLTASWAICICLFTTIYRPHYQVRSFPARCLMIRLRPARTFLDVFLDHCQLIPRMQMKLAETKSTE